MRFDNDNTVIVESERDLGNAHIYMSEGIHADYHALPLKIHTYPQELPPFAGGLLIDKLKSEASGEHISLSDQWAKVVESQAPITDDPA